MISVAASARRPRQASAAHTFPAPRRCPRRMLAVYIGIMGDLSKRRSTGTLSVKKPSRSTLRDGDRSLVDRVLPRSPRKLSQSPWPKHGAPMLGGRGANGFTFGTRYLGSRGVTPRFWSHWPRKGAATHGDHCRHAARQTGNIGGQKQLAQSHRRRRFTKPIFSRELEHRFDIHRKRLDPNRLRGLEHMRTLFARGEIGPPADFGLTMLVSRRVILEFGSPRHAAPKGLEFSQPRATPWGNATTWKFSRPNGPIVQWRST